MLNMYLLLFKGILRKKFLRMFNRIFIPFLWNEYFISSRTIHELQHGYQSMRQ